VAGGSLIVLGLIVFLAGAAPLYWSKIRPAESLLVSREDRRSSPLG
jgi:hypothetical protein